jgi:phosphoethanolamine N-methyltransferase
MKDGRGHEYTEEFVAGLEWIWGEGFLSPGGPEEVAAILDGLDLDGAEVLDIGCGLGAIDLLLVRAHGAARVTGIDIERPLIERARRRVAAAGLSDRIELRLVEPGPFPFADGAFDVVFSKDSIIHIPDKTALYGEVLRVLRPGGLFAASDWLLGGEKPYSAPMRAWLDIVGITFDMETPENTAAALEAAGFAEVDLRDRNDWYRKAVREELARASGEYFERLSGAIGRAAAEHRLASTTAKMAVVDRGELRPVHMRGRKPIR